MATASVCSIRRSWMKPAARGAAITTLQALRAELDGITDTIPPERFLQAMADAIAGAGNYAFRDMFYGFIARQAEPKVQAAVLLLNRLVECGEPNVRRYLAILGNPTLREKVFGF